MALRFLVNIDFPYSWTNGYTTKHETVEEAEAYAERAKKSSGAKGTDNYIKVEIYELVKEVN